MRDNDDSAHTRCGAPLSRERRKEPRRRRRGRSTLETGRCGCAPAAADPRDLAVVEQDAIDILEISVEVVPEIVGTVAGVAVRDRIRAEKRDLAIRHGLPTGNHTPGLTEVRPRRCTGRDPPKSRERNHQRHAEQHLRPAIRRLTGLIHTMRSAYSVRRMREYAASRHRVTHRNERERC